MRRLTIRLAALAVLAGAFPVCAQQNYAIIELAGPGQAIAADYTGSFGGPSINADGKVAFEGSLGAVGFRSTRAIFLDDGLASSPAVPIYINRPPSDPECQALVPDVAERSFRCIDAVNFGFDVILNSTTVVFETYDKVDGTPSEIVAGDGTAPLLILLQETRATNGLSFEFPAYLGSQIKRADFNESGYVAAWMNQLDDGVPSTGCASLFLSNGAGNGALVLGQPRNTTALTGIRALDWCNPPDVVGLGTLNRFDAVPKVAEGDSGTRVFMSAFARDTTNATFDGLLMFEALQANADLVPVVSDSTGDINLQLAANSTDVVYATTSSIDQVLRLASVSSPGGAFRTLATSADGFFRFFQDVDINEAGTVVFTASTVTGQGLFTWDPASQQVTPLLQIGDPYPVGTTQSPPDTVAFTYIGDGAINNAGVIVAMIQVTKAAGGNERKIIKFLPSIGQPDIAVADNVGASDDLQADLGSVLVNDVASVTVTVNNLGSADLVMGSIDLLDPLNTRFSIVGNNCDFTILPPLSACQFNVNFAPDNNGPFTGTVNITSNDPDEPVVQFALAGNGEILSLRLTDPDLPDNDQALDYGPYTVGSRTRRRFGLHNVGTRDIEILRYDNIAAPFEGPFSGTIGLLAGATTGSFSMDFVPAALGAAAGTVAIVYTDAEVAGAPERTLVLSLAGTGVAEAPLIGVFTEDLLPLDQRLDFGTVVAGSVTVADITISNDGGGTLDVFGGSNVNAAYSIIANNCDGAHLVGGENCVLTVRFEPNATGDYTDAVSLQYGDLTSASTFTVPVQGRAVDAPVTIVDGIDPADDQDLPFGFIAPGDSTSATIEVFNNLSEAVSIGSLASAAQTLGAPFSIVNDGCSGLTLAPATQPGDRCSLDVLLTPAAGAAEGDVSDVLGIPVTAPVAVEVPVSVSARVGNRNYDLRLRKSAMINGTETDDIPSGTGVFEYRIALTNDGPDDARDVVVTDVLPAELRIVDGQAPNPGAGSFYAASGEWSLPELVTGATLTLDIPVEVVDAETARCVLNTATITAAVGDSNPGNNSAGRLVGVRNAAGDATCADLYVEIVAWREFNYVNGADPEAGLEFDIEFGNSGPHEVALAHVSLTISPAAEGMAAVQMDSAAYQQLCDNNDIGTLVQSEEDALLPVGNQERAFTCDRELLPGESHRLTVRWIFPLLDAQGGGIAEVRFDTAISRVDPALAEDPAETNQEDSESVTVEDRLRPGAGSAGSGCFIATAAYGTPWEPNVATLRQFRDEWLQTNALGRGFVAFYYEHSPPIAAWIAEREWARALTRGVLTPLVLAIEHPAAAAGFAFGGFGLLGILVGRRRRVEIAGSQLEN